jgi:hypothetical protein
MVVFAALVGEDALIVGWAQLEDDMAGVAEDAGFAVRALGRQRGLDPGHKVIKVEHRAGPHVLQSFAELLALQDADGDQLQSWIVVVLQLLHGSTELRPLLYTFHLSWRVQSRRSHVVVWVVQAVQYRAQDRGVVEQVRGGLMTTRFLFRSRPDPARWPRDGS